MTETSTESTPKQHPSLVAALVAAQASVATVTKAAKNTFHGYKYASSESIIEAAQAALSANGLIAYPTAWLTRTDETGAVKLSVNYCLESVTGDKRTFATETSVVPEKGRPIDKAEAGALTLNLAYFLRGLLLIAREDESTSVEKRDDTKFEPVAKPAVTPEVIANWTAQIAAATDIQSLLAVGKAMTAGGVAGVPEIRAAYTAAYQTFTAAK